MCSDGKRDLTFFNKCRIFLNFFSACRASSASAQVFSALLPLGNYKFKSNQATGASGVEVKMVKICSSNPAGPFL